VSTFLIVGESFEVLLLVNIIFSLSLLIVFIKLILSIRNTGKSLFESVSEKPVSSIVDGNSLFKEDGTFETYYPSGVLKERGTKINDNLHGEYEEYYPNGTIKVRGIYENGMVVGKLNNYYDNGELRKS
jgi:antitoxin component YwqK of YwqJK toxin-antitoxin module